jgi:hypothetical protein
MLVEEKLITQEQLEAAREEHRALNREERFGDFLVQRGFISQEKLLQLLGKQVDFATMEASAHAKSINMQLIIIIVLQALVLLGIIAEFMFIRSYLFKEIDFLTDEDAISYLAVFIGVMVLLFMFSSLAIQKIFSVNKKTIL